MALTRQQRQRSPRRCVQLAHSLIRVSRDRPVDERDHRIPLTMNSIADIFRDLGLMFRF